VQTVQRNAVTSLDRSRPDGKLVAQSQAQNMGKSGVDRGNLGRQQTGDQRGIAQPCAGIHRTRTTRQRENPCRVDKDAAAKLLQIDLVAEGSTSGDHIAPKIERNLYLQGIGSHQVEKGRCLHRQRQQLAAQAFTQIGVAAKRLQVEKDAGIEQCSWFRNTHPLDELLLPFIERQAPGRVAGHDPAAAQLESAVGEASIDVLGKGQEQRPQSIGFMMIGRAEDQPVVLIADKGLFVAPLRTERQPAPGTGRQAVAARGQFDDAD